MNENKIIEDHFPKWGGTFIGLKFSSDSLNILKIKIDTDIGNKNCTDNCVVFGMFK